MPTRAVGVYLLGHRTYLIAYANNEVGLETASHFERLDSEDESALGETVDRLTSMDVDLDESCWNNVLTDAGYRSELSFARAAKHVMVTRFENGTFEVLALRRAGAGHLAEVGDPKCQLDSPNPSELGAAVKSMLAI